MYHLQIQFIVIFEHDVILYIVEQHVKCIERKGVKMYCCLALCTPLSYYEVWEP